MNTDTRQAARTSAQDMAYRLGRAARMRGISIQDANVELARRLGWTRRAQFNDDLLDECERGWYSQDELTSPADYD